MSLMIYRRRRDRNHSVIFFIVSYRSIVLFSRSKAFVLMKISRAMKKKKKKKMNKKKFKYFDLHEEIKLTSFVKFYWT